MASLLFYKNIAVVGGLVVLAAFGPGAWSIEGRGASQRAPGALKMSGAHA